MRAISEELAEAVWERQCGLDEPAARQLAERFFEEQPALALYVTAMEEATGEEQPADEEVASDLPGLVLSVWECMTEVYGADLPMIAPEQVEAAEAANVEALQSLDGSDEAGAAAGFAAQLLDYRQTGLMRFCLQTLMQDYEDDPDSAPEDIGMHMIVVKTVIDCLDAVPPRR